MEQPTGVVATREEIINNYRKATYCYFIPFGLAVIGALLNFFLLLALLTLLPAGILGLYFTRRGLLLAGKSGDREKKDVGYVNVLLGILVLGLGIVGVGIAYVATD